MVQKRPTAKPAKGVPLWKHIAVCVVTSLFWAGVIYASGWADDKPLGAVAALFGLFLALAIYYLVTHYKDGFIDWEKESRERQSPVQFMLKRCIVLAFVFLVVPPFFKISGYAPGVAFWGAVAVGIPSLLVFWLRQCRST